MEEESAPPFRMEQRGRVGIANRGMKGDGAVVVDTAPWVGFVAGIPGRETCSNFPRRRNDSRKRRN